MNNTIFCAGLVTGMVLVLVILNLGRMTQESAPRQPLVPISSTNPITPEQRGLCLASIGRCVDVDAPPPQICLVSSRRCAATGKVELLTTRSLSGSYRATGPKGATPNAREPEYLASVRLP